METRKNSLTTLPSSLLICCRVEGGELFERIVAEEYLMEEDAVDYVKQILEALKFMHERHVVHLDLKVMSGTLLFFSIHKKTHKNFLFCLGLRSYL